MEETGEIYRTMAHKLTARSDCERKQSSTAPAAVATALLADVANLELLTRQHKELLRLRVEGEEKNCISGADLAAHAARGCMLPHIAATATVFAASACGPNPCQKELRGTVNVSDTCFVISTLKTFKSKLNIYFLRQKSPQLSGKGRKQLSQTTWFICRGLITHGPPRVARPEKGGFLKDG